MNTPSNEGNDINPVSEAFRAAEAKASKASEMPKEAEASVHQGEIPANARDVSSDKKEKGVGVFAKAVAWVSAWIRTIKALLYLVTRPVTIAILVVGVGLGAYLTQEQEHTSFHNLHGDLHDAGFFRNIGFKLDTEKQTTIHGRGTKIETITLKDKKGRFYSLLPDGGWLEVK